MSGNWQPLDNATPASRYNDVFFLTPELGWVVNGAGQILNTRDGGQSWQPQFANQSIHFRSVGFADAERGWAGSIGTFRPGEVPILLQTADGGANWTSFDTFDGPRPKGLCGMCVVNENVICAVGRVRGPSFFIRTIDGGQTWTSKDMSAHAAGLIDVHFFDADVGYAVGLSSSDHDASSGVVLFTEDGGETWETRHHSTRTGEWCWKLSFPSRDVGYASLQRNRRSPIFFLKTSDGGATWEEKLFHQSHYFAQGIGFVSELEGWIGGNSSLPVFHTTDGGDTWSEAELGRRMNRFRFLDDGLGYAVGQRVFKFTNGNGTGNGNGPVADGAD